MKTYQFESRVEESGVIVLPQYMENLKRHRVKLTVVDLESAPVSPCKLLTEITERYITAGEDDLDINDIYHQRDRNQNRGIVFD